MIISGRSTEEHLNNLDTVLERLNTYNMRVNCEKCEFFKDSVTYWGHDIQSESLQKPLDKISAVVNAPKPEHTQQLRSFLGLINYYRRFLPNLSSVVAPMNELLQGEKVWKWTKACDEAFSTVKEQCNFRPSFVPLQP
ncbi:uncharacterized mitochondrial protein AtMg00860-like [Anneissia japonica]|uniref:uncharacterized mitochondrial protein AtMg00860-like n=1 Tax=Anneissia japonica TaxID=1529436 RepID=UPI0014256496|nr:uncharacterized mitochondrial protein AtMg00860-like [Anneissia japonica]